MARYNMARLLFGILLPCLLFCGAESARAAFKSASDGMAVEDACNPRPQADDIILPMPCNLSLALRAVAVPAGSLVRDRAFAMGVNNAADAARDLYERRFTAHISAPFTAENLPEGWRAHLNSQSSAGDTYYFIGKYEISRLQYEAVMAAVNNAGEEDAALCPKMDSRGGSLPASGLSWFDAQDFLRKYNAWLVRGHQQALPRFAGTQNVGFLRLPTEEEWEYAARGGAQVPQEWWADKDIFPLARDARLEDYGVYSAGQALTGPAPIGSRRANPLGLHDTVGNVREMMDGFFRFSVPDMRGGALERRLHGAAGGTLAKGGSYLSDENAVIPGWRDEVPLFTAAGPGAPGDLGFRVALAGLNVPSAARLEELRREEHARQAGATVDLAGQTDPAKALQMLAASAEGPLRASLERIHGLLKDREDAENNRRLDGVERALRSLLYQAETLRAFAFRYSAAKKQLAGIRELMGKDLDKANHARVEKLLKEANSDLSDYMESLQMGANYYKQNLGVVLEAADADLERLLAQARREYGGDGIFNEHIGQNIDVLERFIKQARGEGISAITSKMILTRTIPEQHLKNLPL